MGKGREIDKDGSETLSGEQQERQKWKGERRGPNGEENESETVTKKTRTRVRQGRERDRNVREMGRDGEENE